MPAHEASAVFTLGQVSLLSLVLRYALRLASDGALAFAWGKVCFSSWDSFIGGIGGLVAWERWPPGARALLAALYPAYFVYTNTRKLNGPDGPARPRNFNLLLAAACALAAAHGLRDGARDRREAAR